jgi:hypothetical protein
MGTFWKGELFSQYTLCTKPKLLVSKGAGCSRDVTEKVLLPCSAIPGATHAWAKSSKAYRKHGLSFFGVSNFQSFLNHPAPFLLSYQIDFTILALSSITAHFPVLFHGYFHPSTSCITTVGKHSLHIFRSNNVRFKQRVLPYYKCQIYHKFYMLSQFKYII